MNKNVLAVRIQRAAERLRQEHESFEQRKFQEARWFNLSLVNGYSSVISRLVVLGVASYVLLNNAGFPTSVVASAGVALFVGFMKLRTQRPRREPAGKMRLRRSG